MRMPRSTQSSSSDFSTSVMQSSLVRSAPLTGELAKIAAHDKRRGAAAPGRGIVSLAFADLGKAELDIKPACSGIFLIDLQENILGAPHLRLAQCRQHQPPAEPGAPEPLVDADREDFGLAGCRTGEHEAAGRSAENAFAQRHKAKDRLL